MKDSGPVETVYKYIKSRIVSKLIFPGNRIIEEDLAKETGISRTSVRSALSKLQYEGFVEILPNKGAFVAKPSAEDIDNVYNVRFALELGVIKLAMGKISDSAIKRMEKGLQEQRKLKEHFSISEYAILNRGFHWEVVLAAQNSYYEKFLNEIYNKVQIYMIFYDTSIDNSGSLVSHAALLDALKNNDLEAGINAVIKDNSIAINDIGSTRS